MAWEQRGTGRYYYHAHRCGDRVVKTYLGTGPAGEMAAELDARARALRRQEALHLRDLEAQLAQLDTELDRLDRACGLMLQATLTVAGYHRVNYAWRRIRDCTSHIRHDCAAVR